jgi:hypothetical protein
MSAFVRQVEVNIIRKHLTAAAVRCQQLSKQLEVRTEQRDKALRDAKKLATLIAVGDARTTLLAVRLEVEKTQEAVIDMLKNGKDYRAIAEFYGRATGRVEALLKRGGLER